LRNARGAVQGLDAGSPTSSPNAASEVSADDGCDKCSPGVSQPPQIIGGTLKAQQCLIGLRSGDSVLAAVRGTLVPNSCPCSRLQQAMAEMGQEDQFKLSSVNGRCGSTPAVPSRNGRNRVRRETGKELMVRVHYDEGVAIHIGPESCAGGREAVREALTGECAGQPPACAGAGY
jgi:hypothetical protein